MGWGSPGLTPHPLLCHSERDSAGGAHCQQDERGDRAAGHQAGWPVWPGHHPHPQALPHRQPQCPGPVAPLHQQTLCPHCPGPAPAAPIKAPLPTLRLRIHLSSCPQRHSATPCPDRAAFIARGHVGLCTRGARHGGQCPSLGGWCVLGGWIAPPSPPLATKTRVGAGWESPASSSCLFPLSLTLLGQEGQGCSPLGTPRAATPLLPPLQG